MKHFVFAFFILLVWFAFGSWLYLCNMKGLCAEDISDELRGTSTMTGAEEIDDSIESTQKISPEFSRKNIATSGQMTENPELRKILYFDFDSDKYLINKELEKYITDVKTFLKTYPDKKIQIIGHTDNVGESFDNEWIGMQRAKSAKDYLVDHGISEERILLVSKGETEPIAPNSSKEGRRRNRRVEIMMNKK